MKTAREQLTEIREEPILDRRTRALLDFCAALVAESEEMRARIDHLEYGSRKRVP